MKLLALIWSASVCLSAHALEIASAKGAAVLGRTLDLRVNIKLDAPDEDPCIDSQVFFAETRAAAISQWTPASGAAAGVLRVTTTKVVDEPIITLYVNAGCSQRFARKFVFFAEVDSQAPSGAAIGQVPNTVAVPVKPAAAPAAVDVAPVQAGGADKLAKSNATLRSARQTASKVIAVASEGRTDQGLRSAIALDTGGSEGATRKKSKQDKEAAKTTKSRLRLEPIELQAPPGLKSSSELSLPGVEANAATRASAAALWRAINSSPEDWLRENERMRSLEGQLGGMQSKLLAQQEVIAKMQGEMDRQRDYSYWLFGFLALVLAGGAYVWVRSRSASGTPQPWWKVKEFVSSGRKSRNEKPDEDDHEDEETETPAPVAPKRNQSPDAFFSQEPAQLHLNSKPKVQPAQVAGLQSADPEAQTNQPIQSERTVPGRASEKKKPKHPEVELDGLLHPQAGEATKHQQDSVSERLVVESTSSFPPELDSVPPPPPEVKRKPKSEHAVNNAFESFFGVELTGKNYDVQELFDVQEQSEFFITVGQHDQAIEILLNHIDTNPEGSPLAYLDLFALYHKLNKRPEYETLSARFTVHFNARIPTFEEYGKEQSRNLENYTAAMTRIQLLWPSEKTLNVIAESIFRKPETPESAFSLEAYQELLLLYGILKEIHENENPAPDFVASGFQDSGFGSGFQSTRMEALPTIDLAPSKESVQAGASSFDPKDAGPSESLLEFDVYTPPKSSRLGLDIDLAEPDSIGEQKALPIKKTRARNSRS
jgi:hypothetical protein